jgi:hypothetical protein
MSKTKTNSVRQTKLVDMTSFYVFDSTPNENDADGEF